MVFVLLIGMTVRRGVTDPVCGMTVDRSKALRLERNGRTHHFCSEHCRHEFEDDPEGYEGDSLAPSEARVAVHSH